MIRLLSVALVLIGSLANAQTPFPARIVEAGQTVVVPKGDYVLSKQVVVRAGGKLVLEAGCNVSVAGLGLPVQVYGAFEANGTAAEPVTFGPDASGVCGTLQTYGSRLVRSSVQATYLEWTTTLNGNCLFLSACDYSLVSCKITNKSTAAKRACVASVADSVGVIFDCMLDGSGDALTTPCAAVVVGNGVGQSDKVQLIDTLIINASDPISIRKNFALVSGVIE